MGELGEPGELASWMSDWGLEEKVVILAKSGKRGKSCKSGNFPLETLCFSMVSLLLTIKINDLHCKNNDFQ